jgi:choline dehydrogenase-like flavoprotein
MTQPPDNVGIEPTPRLGAELVVVGSGPGGSVTAGLLAEAGRDVLLIEEGPYVQPDVCPPFTRAEMVRKYRNGGVTVTLGRAKMAYVEGRCAGGGSEVNSGLYHRLPPGVLEEWQTGFAVDALSDTDLRPHYEACEAEMSVGRLPTPASPASRKLEAGAAALGWSAIEAPRWYRYGGPNGSEASAHGMKQTMTRTFLPRLLAAGGRLLAETRAVRLESKRGGWRLRAVRQVSGRPAQLLEIEARTVFVAGGAIQTPALLRRSGIRRNVGNSLRAHPTVKVVALFDDPVNASGQGVPVHQVKEFAPRYSFGGSISTPPYLALAMLDHGAAADAVMRDWRHAAVYYAMTRGGRGVVRNAPPWRDPLVRFALEPAEYEELAEALRELCRCLFAAGAARLFPSIAGCPSLANMDDLDRLPRTLEPSRANLMTIHLFGSCPMGEDRRHCAVDSFGRVHGVGGLHVADGSLLCGPPGVNPQGAIMAVARRNVCRFLGQS